MKLLIITQKVNKNDQILGFFHAWLLEFSKQVEQLTVICLEKGEHELSKHVRVHSLGKEHNTSRIQKLKLLWKYVVGNRNEYDAVFVHMNPIYVVLFGWFWKLAKKPVSLWYMHKHVDMKLRIAETFVQRIFTGSEHSLRLATSKKVITGHGIDTTFFIPDSAKKSSTPYVLTVGRIAPAKQTVEIIKSIKTIPEATLHIVGDAVTEADSVYLETCHAYVREHALEEKVIFHGAVTHKETRMFYQQATVFVNISKTGSLDKVLLEALACGATVVTSNDAGKDIEGVQYFNEENQSLEEVLLQTITANAVAPEATNDARAYVEREHGLERLITKIVERISGDVSV